MTQWPVFSVRLDGDRFGLAMVAKRAYRIARGGCIPETAEPFTVASPGSGLAGDAGPGRPEEEFDLFAPLKPATDVLLRGSAHSTRGPVSMLDTALRIGAFRQHVRVWGQRTIHLDAAGHPCFSRPEPFQSTPLTWESAYGGRDVHAERKARPRKRAFARAQAEDAGAFAYPRNPAGRGFFLDEDRERIEGTAAPGLEDPEDPVTADRLLARDPLDWIDRPVAACYEPIDLFSFPRVCFWLGIEHHAPARPVHEMRKGLLRPEDVRERPLGTPPAATAYTCSSAGLAGTRLQGNERVSLWNLHPKHEVLEFVLPCERPRLLVEPPGCGIHDLAPMLQTVLIEPGAERVTLTWAATMEVAAPYSPEACETMRSAVRWER